MVKGTCDLKLANQKELVDRSYYRTVEDARGIDSEQLTVLVSRLFGWSRQGQEIQPKLESLIANLLDEGLLEGTLERLTVS